MRMGILMICLVFPAFRTVSVLAGTVRPDSLSSAHRRMVPPPDTVFLVPDSLRKQKADLFFQKLEEKAARLYWAKVIHNIVVIPSNRKPLRDTLQTEQGILAYQEYEGRIVRNIQFKKLEIFGPTVTDTSAVPQNWIERGINRMHFYTSDRVLMNHMLIQPGAEVKADVIADNERLLREIPSVEDARIYLRPVGTDSVDVFVVTKDVLAKAFSLELSDAQKGKLRVWDQNFLGTGYELDHILCWDPDHAPVVGYEGLLRVKNIMGSFADARLNYVTGYRENLWNLNISRDFYTSGVRYAGGMEWTQGSILQTAWIHDSLVWPVPIGRKTYSMWAGRAFPVQTQNWFTRNRNNIVLAGSLSRDAFYERPDEVAPNVLYPYQNKTLLMGSLSFSAQDFYRTNLVYSFGRTEDIPFGSLLNILGGVEWNEYYTRLYSGFSFSKGYYVGRLAYVYTKLELGGFLHQGQLEQGIFRYDINAFTNLIVFNCFYFRHFFKLNYTLGINRFDDEFLYIREPEGLTGFDNRLVRGKKRLMLKGESVLFTPWYVLGFRPAFYGFLDAGWIGDEAQFVLYDPFYAGTGFGIRIRNERLVFDTFQAGMIFYPEKLPGMNSAMFVFGTMARLRFPNFFVRKPDIISFQ
ncbi:MAG: hypothetical protein GX419_06955 [Bacteroidales bacterium]|nr:hypothetical protein [Bacteroidales bacterium]